MQFMRHGKNHMVVLAGQQAALLLGQPAFDLHPGALGTHPAPTGVVPDAFDMPLGTGVDMSTQERRPTRQERPDRPTHIVRQRVVALVGRIAQLQHRLERELLGWQGVSITAHAALHDS
jgi:hypothetical protein